MMMMMMMMMDINDMTSWIDLVAEAIKSDRSMSREC